ncbi:hypothetical protein [Saccharopolyspora pogona]|uniref:hypothetical protein n=1 Tax=Saccharopolyspora pogona TaxID=333966 RepID=UPI001686E298|nr:hypothetical protein [Saccharopolyspora pogona]
MGKLPDFLFPAIPHRAGRIAATLVAAAAVATVWAPAAITDWPLASVPGATVSTALGLGVLAVARVLLLRAWRHAAQHPDDDASVVLGTGVAALVGLPGAAALLGGGPLNPYSQLSQLTWVMVILWGAHEGVYCYREYHRAEASSDESATSSDQKS